jgi:hypothetical protein
MKNEFHGLVQAVVRCKLAYLTVTTEFVRVVNEYDKIPTLPILPMWSHPRRRCIVIRDNLKIKNVKKDVGPWRLCCALVPINLYEPMKDHDCDEYIERINALTLNRASAT